MRDARCDIPGRFALTVQACAGAARSAPVTNGEVSFSEP